MEENAFVDLHVHSKYSDGTDNADELLDNVIKSNIGIFSVTDHDNVEFYDNVDYNKLKKLKLITGMEFSCITDAGKCHILGYNMDLKNDKLLNTITATQNLRHQKLQNRLAYLKEQHGIDFSNEETDYLFSLTSAGKPHIAQLLIKKGLAKTIDEAIKVYLKRLPQAVDRISAKEAIDAIVSASGIPVWAHPLGGEGEKRLDREQFEKQLHVLINFGIKGLECYYSRYNDDEICFLLEQSKENNLLISGGSDYHGTVKNIPLGKLNDFADSKLNNNIQSKLTILSEI